MATKASSWRGEAPLACRAARADDAGGAPERRRAARGADRSAIWPAILLVADDALDRFVADSAREAKVSPEELLSTDDNLYLEYATPKNNVAGMPSIEQTIDMVARYRPADLAVDRSAP